jgi:hypothetical protein
VAGSVLLHACADCVFMFAARQLRIHTSSRCDYYLRVMSRPIIEHCTGLRFAPYGVAYPQLEAQLAAAGLAGSRPAAGGQAGPPAAGGGGAVAAAAPAAAGTNDLWRAVDDFGWHRVQKSPNWDVLPSEQRLTAPREAAAGYISVVYPAGEGGGPAGGAAATGAAPKKADAAGAASAGAAVAPGGGDDDEL